MKSYRDKEYLKIFIFKWKGNGKVSSVKGDFYWSVSENGIGKREKWTEERRP